MSEENEEASQDRFYVKVPFDNYEDYVAMIDQILLKITGRVSERTAEEEAKMRKSFEELQAKVANLKKNEGSKTKRG